MLIYDLKNKKKIVNQHFIEIPQAPSTKYMTNNNRPNILNIKALFNDKFIHTALQKPNHPKMQIYHFKTNLIQINKYCYCNY